MSLFKNKECPEGMDEYLISEWNFNLDIGTWRVWVYNLRNKEEWREMEYAWQICCGPVEYLKYKLLVPEGTEVDLGYNQE